MNSEIWPHLFEPDFEDCILSSLEPLSLECELHLLTTTPPEAKIKVQLCLLTPLLPEPTSISWQSLPPVKAQLSFLPMLQKVL